MKEAGSIKGKLCPTVNGVDLRRVVLSLVLKSRRLVEGREDGSRKRGVDLWFQLREKTYSRKRKSVMAE